MTTYDRRKLKCSVCGKTEEHRILMSTNSFGFPDMDTRRTGMARETLGDEVVICPNCGYVAYDIEEKIPSKVKKFVLSTEYQDRSIKDNWGKSVETYSALRDILLLMGNKEGAFWATMKAAWVADDSWQSGAAIQIRKCALKILETINPSEFGISEDIHAQLKADLLRRTGDFTKAIELCSNYKAKNPIIQNIIDCELILSQNHESRCCNCSSFEDKIYGDKLGEPVSRQPETSGTYFDYTTFHVPRSDKTEIQYEDSVWPPKPFNTYGNDMFYIKDGLLRIAIADGVSAASKYTKIWADLLTMHYYFKGKDILKHIVDYSKEWHKYALDAAKKAYYPHDLKMYRHDKNEINAKGASTTFAGAEFDINSSAVNFFTIGDSCFFVVRGDTCIAQIPKLNSPEKFTTCPSQIYDTDEKMDYEMEQDKFRFEDGDVIVGATDGVACWVVQPEDGWTIMEKLRALINCKNSDEFEKLVEKERHTVISAESNVEKFAMHDDDSTISVLRIICK